MTRDEAERVYRETAERIGDSEPADGVLVGAMSDPLDKLRDYARQLAAHPRWRWEPGMVDVNGSVVVALDCHGEAITAWRTPERIDEIGYESGCGAPPDIHHPATRGWLLAMLREATGCVDLAVVQDGDTWETMPMYGDCYATEGEALAAALLAVWGAS